MNEDKLLDLLHDFKMAKKDLEENLLELTVIAHAIETTINGAKEGSAELQESVQNRLDAALNNQKLVSQLREQINASVAVVEPSEGIMNESHETVEPTISLAEAFRSQLEEQEEASELDEEDFDEEYDYEEDCDVYDEEYVEEEAVEQEGALSPLAQTLRNQINEAELASLPDIDVDVINVPIPSDIPNLSDVLREQAEKPSLAEQLRSQMAVSTTEESATESAEVNADNASSLTLTQMIEQLRIDINNTSDVDDEKKEEELVVATAASSDNNVAASLRQQLLVQELKKQLK